MGLPVESDCPVAAQVADPSQEVRDVVSEVMAHAERHGSEDYPYAYRFLDMGCPEHLLEARAFKGTSEFVLRVVDTAGRVLTERGEDEGPFTVKHDLEAPGVPSDLESVPERPWFKRLFKGA